MPNLQHSEKHARPKHTYARLIAFLVTYQDCIFIIQKINFPKILYNPQLRWHPRNKCICQLAFIFFIYENVTWHFKFESWTSSNEICQTYSVSPSSKRRGYSSPIAQPCRMSSLSPDTNTGSFLQSIEWRNSEWHCWALIMPLWRVTNLDVVMKHPCVIIPWSKLCVADENKKKHLIFSLAYKTRTLNDV